MGTEKSLNKDPALHSEDDLRIHSFQSCTGQTTCSDGDIQCACMTALLSNVKKSYSYIRNTAAQIMWMLGLSDVVECSSIRS